MAAVAAALSLLPHGGTVVAPDAAYNGTLATLAVREAEGSATVRRVDVADTEAVLAALDGADLLWLESPTNPLLEVADLPTLLGRRPRARRARAWSTTPSPRPCSSARSSSAPTSSCTR